MHPSEFETLFRRDGRLGHIVLNRPQVLNALSPAQYLDLDERLYAWAGDPGVGLVLIEGAGGRAFSAGGDIRAVHEAWRRGDHEFNRALFRREYELDRRIHHFAKPYVSILDGIVMGGGAGISVNGRFRVATERMQFAMPEAAIGFFPDVGATHFLNRCPGRLGLHLGLTGARLGATDALWAGIATHYVPAAACDDLCTQLTRAAGSAEPLAAACSVLDAAHRDPGPAPMAAVAAEIDRAYGAERVPDIVDALAAAPGAWAAEARDALAARSPFSLAVIHRQLTAGRTLGFDDAIQREYRLACSFLAGHDLYEGIRALVVDKDRQPRWRPASLAEVDPAAVEAAFEPSGGDRLQFS